MAKWYIIHAVSGAENSVKKALEDQIAKHKMSDYFEEIMVPLVEVPEIKKGKQVMVEKKIMPGYIFIKMNMDDKSWHLVKGVPKITGFLGSKTRPQPLKESEVKAIFSQIESESENAISASLYKVGDTVRVIDGPFDEFSGSVDEVDPDKQRLKISVLIFGKSTSIDLSFSQVKKDEAKE